LVADEGGGVGRASVGLRGSVPSRGAVGGSVPLVGTGAGSDAIGGGGGRVAPGGAGRAAPGGGGGGITVPDGGGGNDSVGGGGPRRERVPDAPALGTGGSGVAGTGGGGTGSLGRLGRSRLRGASNEASYAAISSSVGSVPGICSPERSLPRIVTRCWSTTASKSNTASLSLMLASVPHHKPHTVQAVSTRPPALVCVSGDGPDPSQVMVSA
jgi:hypothetical protein